MKTKHLFFATALVASFASCTNEEIVEQQGVANVERPTVENVKLNFVGEGVDSRLAFGSKGYAWEASDVIGALLMDQPVAGSNKDTKWGAKYTLTDWVNTSYPFAYNAETKIWSNDAKMLEGNYFFAFPFSSYNGGREVKHSLTEQAQTGVASTAVAESYAKNQFFVGYSQIFGGTEAEDALEDVEMTSILGGIQFRIINNGSKTYHVNKLVVSGYQVASELTLTPANGTAADYTDDFNYANYVGDEEATGGNYNYIKAEAEAEDFERASLLRKIVKANNHGKAQLNVTGTKAERAIAKGATGYAVVMVNPFEKAKYELQSGEQAYKLNLDIYTDEGVISVNLTDVINDIKDTDYAGVLVDKKIEKVAHDVANTIIIKFTDDAVGSIQSAEIYDEEDLLQLIEWNAKSDIKVAPVATLVEDVEFTKEMFDLLKSNKNVTLAINGTAKELTLAANLPADVLDYEGLKIAADVELVVEGTIEAAEDDKDKTEVIFNKMTIAEGGVLNVNNTKPVLPASIINEGTVNFGEKTIAVVNLTNEEEGIINIVKGADVKGAVVSNATKFINNGTVNNNGYVERIINNADAVITLGEGATLKGLDNKKDATVNTAKDSQVVGDNAKGALINWVTGATVSVDGDGMVSAEAPASVAKDAYKDSDINTLRLKENTITTFADDEPGATLNIIAAKGATLKVANGQALTIGTLIVDEDMTIITNNVTGDTKSTLTVGSVEIAEEAELTNRGILNVTTWKNEGIVYNNGYIGLPLGYTETNWGVVKYTAPNATQAPTADAVKAAALKEVITEAVNAGRDATLNAVLAHVAAVQADPITWGDYSKALAYTYETTTQTEFDAALKAVKEDNAAALKTALLAEGVSLNIETLNPTRSHLYTESGTAGTTGYKNAKTVAYETFKANVMTAATGLATDLDAVVLISAEGLTEAHIDAILAAKAPTAFIWKGCNLQLAIAVWKKYDGIKLAEAANDYTAGIALTTPGAVADAFVAWAMKAMENTTIAAELSTAGVTITTLPTFAKYTNAQFNSCK